MSCHQLQFASSTYGQGVALCQIAKSAASPSRSENTFRQSGNSWPEDLDQRLDGLASGSIVQAAPGSVSKLQGCLTAKIAEASNGATGLTLWAWRLEALDGAGAG
jgi:hypothetical protein